MTEQTDAFSPWADEQKFQELYVQLRSIARARMAGNAGHTLTPTGLVNEAMVKMLASEQSGQFNGDTHFIATAATAMRHILVDHARRKGAGKRTSATAFADGQDFWSDARVQMSPEETLHISREIDKFAEREPLLGRLVEMRVFGGLTFAEIGALLDMETKTVERRWRYAAAQLRTSLEN